MKKIINYILRNLFVWDTVILFKMEQPQEINSAVNIKLATYENIKDTLNFQDEKYLSIFKEFIDKGDTGYLGYLEGACIHRSWVITKENAVIYLHPLIKRKLKKNEVYIHFCETSISARGNNVYPSVISKIAKDYSDKDVLICVNEKNVASIRGVEKAGYKPIQLIKIVGLLGLTIKFQKKTGR